MGFSKLSGKMIKFFIYVVVVILVNLAGLTLFFRYDLTANKIYSLAKASKRVVSTLSEPLTIKVFFTKNLPAPYNNIERYLHDLLEEYAVYANRYFNFIFYDVSPEEGGEISKKARDNQELAKSYGISPVQIQVIDKDEVKFQKAYMGLVLIHGDVIERIPTITSTDGLEYQLTTAIQKLNNKVSALLRLPDKVQIKLYLSSSLKSVAPRIHLQELSEIPRRLEKIISELNDKTYGKLEFSYLDPSKNPELEKGTEALHLLKLKWPNLDGGKIKAGHGVIGLVMQYHQKVVAIPLVRVFRVPLIGTRYELADLGKMEQEINDNLESLIDINQTLGYLADHGTLSLYQPPAGLQASRGEGLNNFRTLVSRNYSIREVQLKKAPIPDGIDCLVIARPTEPFNDYELFQIDQYLMKGKSLALFVDAFKEQMPNSQQAMVMGRQPQYVPLDTGLEKLLRHYGVHIEKAYVLDENCYRQQIPAQFGGGERPIYFAPLIKNRFIDHRLPFMKNIKGLVAFQASPLEIDSQVLKKNGIKAVRLLASSPKSWLLKGHINLNPMFLHPPKSTDEMSSKPLAYLLEGEFPSYFSGKPIPEKPPEKKKSGDKDKPDSKAAKKDTKTDKPTQHSTKETATTAKTEVTGEGVKIEKGKPGKIFIVASSYMLKDNLIDDKGRGPNAMFVLNMIDYLNHHEDIAVLRSKQQRFNPLNDTGPGVKTLVKSLNIVGLPVLVILFGLLVWLRRLTRKRHIQMMFQQ